MPERGPPICQFESADARGTGRNGHAPKGSCALTNKGVRHASRPAWNQNVTAKLKPG